jgi:O-acetyl-ADP-ribose deacetylase (regulator of RNase III)
MRTIRGDLLQLALEGEFDAIVHGCNCQCQMGKGIALSIKQRFPEAYAADLTTVKGDRSKLGTISTAEIQRGDRTFHVVNGYTQFHWRGQGVKADYDAIRKVMKAVKAGFGGKRIGYPRICAGLAGGDLVAIAALIEEELAGESHTLVEYAA